MIIHMQVFFHPSGKYTLSTLPFLFHVLLSQIFHAPVHFSCPLFMPFSCLSLWDFEYTFNLTIGKLHDVNTDKSRKMKNEL